MLLLLATALGLDGGDAPRLVRVEIPDHPGALVSSETGSVLDRPPAPGIEWRWEPVAELDRSPAFEALEATNADLWHDLDHRGQGVRVAVFDPGWFGAAESELGRFSTHDCIAHKSCDTPFEPLEQSGKHGVACAEVVRDLAPDAQLFLVRMGSFTSFENGVQWAIRNDIDLISMSVSFYNDSFHDGTGPFAPLMEALEAHDILLVTSAGNTAREHWMGDYVDADLDGRMDFDGSNRLLFDMGPGQGKRVNINWDQHRICGTTDLDLIVTDLEGDILARSEAVQQADADQCQPVEQLKLDLEEAGRFALEVHHKRGASARLALSILARSGSIVGAVADRSVTIPADHPLAVAVGAVRADRYQTAGAEGFSSWGPNNAGWPKPDIAGPDRLSTATYGAEGFSGTSAATPAVAGLIAVRMSAAPQSTPREAFEWLGRRALSDTPLWEADPELGAGRARLPVPEVTDPGCGRRPLLMPLLLLPLWRRRVRWRR